MVDFQERDTKRSVESEPDESEDEDVADSATGSDDAEEQADEVEEATPGAAIRADEEAEHDHHHHDLETVRAAVVTVSSTRSREDDTAGDAIEAALRDSGAEIPTRDVIRDDFDNVQSAVDALVGRDDVDVVVTTGGTGVTPDDVTVEAIRPLFEKELPGFGELFRRLSFEEIGTKVVGTRAVAGIADGVPVFCLPGSENAARLGTEEIIVEEASHLAGLAKRSEGH
jgi:molybdenum cofactor biosynthesis protein B